VIDQLVVGASPGDAITGMALRLRALFRRRGESTLYGLFRDPALEHEVPHVHALPGPDDPSWRRRVLLVHASIGHEYLEHVLFERRERLVLAWHNVTPPELVRPTDPALADALALGLDQVRRARSRWSAVMADSAFNASVLAGFGYGDVEVLPAGLDVHRLAAVVPDPAAEARWRGGSGPLAVAVGQLLPHKRPDLVVDAVALARRRGLPGLRLALVGHARLAGYAEALRRRAEDAGLGADVVLGAVPDAELAALVRAADVVVSASEHEGLGLPPLEALALGVPVVARACAALPEVLGDAAVLVDPATGADGLAAALVDVLGDPVRRAALADAARRVVAGFDPARLDADALALAERVARRGRD